MNTRLSARSQASPWTQRSSRVAPARPRPDATSPRRGGARSSPSGPTPHIFFLVGRVEDRITIRSTLKAYPVPAARAIWCGDDTRGLQELSRHRYDAIVFFFDPTIGCGLEALIKVRQRSRDTPIVVVAREEVEKTGREALRHGAAAFVPERELAGPILGLSLQFCMLRDDTAPTTWGPAPVIVDEL